MPIKARLISILCFLCNASAPLAAACVVDYLPGMIHGRRDSVLRPELWRVPECRHSCFGEKALMFIL